MKLPPLPPSLSPPASAVVAPDVANLARLEAVARGSASAELVTIHYSCSGGLAAADVLDLARGKLVWRRTERFGGELLSAESETAVAAEALAKLVGQLLAAPPWDIEPPPARRPVPDQRTLRLEVSTGEGRGLSIGLPEPEARRHLSITALVDGLLLLGQKPPPPLPVPAVR